MRREFRTNEILRELRQAPGERLSFRDLAERLAVPRKRHPAFRRFLQQLLNSGILARAKGKGKGYRPGLRPPKEHDVVVTGKVRRHRDGFGFLIAPAGGDDDEPMDDLFLSVREMRDVFDGDTVRAAVVAGRYGKTAGQLLEIVERGRATITGSFRRQGAFDVVFPDPGIWDGEVELEAGAVEPRPGEIVEVEMLRYPQGRKPAVGRIVEMLGPPGELGTILETVIRRHGLTPRFPEDALEQAAALPAGIPPDELAHREDLRPLPTFTIDGADARDFDDAIGIEPLAEGGLRLRVSIADVSYWVEEGTPLDEVALERGTSVYLPDRVIPMLPERLSNDLASLRPNEDRLTLTAEMDFDADGARRKTRVYESVIRSKGRWTYDEVAQFLEGETVPALEEWNDQLVLFRTLAERLRRKRDERGSLDFDLPEPVLDLDETGLPEDVSRSARHESHQLIEEFMLAANEAVAEWFHAKGAPTIHRVHAPPDPVKLSEFVEFAKIYGYLPEFKGMPSSHTLGQFLVSVRGTDYEHAVHHTLLRTMMRAEYAEPNTGHYGLASTHYLHFTSPIRRYPDLIVHRLVRRLLRDVHDRADRGQLRRIAERSSAREQVAVKCEREVVNVLRAAFLSDRIGDEFEGMVSGVTDDGFFVELYDYFIEGMVRIEDLDDDHYRFFPDSRALIDKRKKRRFMIGTPVRVAVQAAHVAVGKVDFRLLEGGTARGPRRNR